MNTILFSTLNTNIHVNSIIYIENNLSRIIHKKEKDVTMCSNKKEEKLSSSKAGRPHLLQTAAGANNKDFLQEKITVSRPCEWSSWVNLFITGQII